MLRGLLSNLRQKPLAPAPVPLQPPAPPAAEMSATVLKWLADDVHPPFALSELRADPRRYRVAAALAGGDISQALQAAGQLLAERPDSAVDRMLLVEALLRSGDLERAHETAEGTLADPGPMGARAAAMLAEQAFFSGDMQRARELAERALAGAGTAVSAHVVLACVLDAQGVADDQNHLRALEHHRRALALRVDSPMPRTFLAGSLLRQNRLREGLTEWVMAEILGGIYSNREACPVWAGQPLGERRLLLIAHSGFGDMILHMRFARNLRAREPRAYLALLTNNSMARLAEATGWFDAVHRDGVDGEPFDWQVTQTHLPLLLDIQAPDLPGIEPYLRVATPHVEAAAAWLAAPQPGRLRVGLRWAGSSSLLHARRSIGLAACAPLFEVRGIDWVALVEDAQSAAQAHGFGLQVAANPLGDFYDTAALMCNLDLIISVDTSIANLGGALGRPTWVMCGAGEDWRWGKAGEHTPWYGSVRVFRHPPDGLNWDVVIREVALALRERVQGSGSRLLP